LNLIASLVDEQIAVGTQKMTDPKRDRLPAAAGLTRI
jgi:hypothetical protein